MPRYSGAASHHRNRNLGVADAEAVAAKKQRAVGFKRKGIMNGGDGGIEKGRDVVSEAAAAAMGGNENGGGVHRQGVVPVEIEEVLEEDADNDNEYIFEEVYEEDEDNYLAESLRQKEKEQRRRNSDKKDPVVEEEQEEQRAQWKPPRPKNMRSHDLNQILDLSIYTLSGILLIVILEQFVQLGLKLKSFKPPRP